MGPLGLFWGLFFLCLYLEWSSKALLEASGRDFESILAPFWLDFERFGRDLGSILRGLGEVWVGFGLLFSGSQLEFKFTGSST